MSTTSGIQERLHIRADAELKKTAHDAIMTMNMTLNRIVPGGYPGFAKIRLKHGDNMSEHSCDSILNAVESAIIDRLQKGYRESVVIEFMQKVDTLHDQIDELRDEIQFD